MTSAAILASLILLACIACILVSIVSDFFVIRSNRRRERAELDRFRNIRPDRPAWLTDQGATGDRRQGP